MKTLHTLLLASWLIMSSFFISCTQNTNKQTPQTEKKDTLTTPPKVQPLTAYFYKRMEGTINEKLPITMHLLRNDKNGAGHYFYHSQGKPIGFDRESHIDDNGKIHLPEMSMGEDGTAANTGLFKGNFINNNTGMAGLWATPDNSKQLKFALEEKYGEGSVPMTINRVYKKYGVCEQEDTTCVVFEAIYPQVASTYAHHSAVNAKIMDVFRKFVSIGEDEATSIQAAADTFIEDFKEASNFDGGFMMGWASNVTTEIWTNDDHVLSLGAFGYWNTGGAHPNHANTYLNFNLKTGEKIKLTDLFKEGAQTTLTQLAEQQLRKTYDIAPDEPLSSFLFDDTFALNDNFYLHKAGITFHYNPYEIAAYAMGHIEIYLPFKDIKEHLKMDGILGDFAKL